MKGTSDFAYYMTSYLSAYLPGQRNVSTNTVKSYRDAFRLMLIYFRNEENILPERIQMKSITKDSVCKFLDWLEKKRSCSITTRNQRLACIHAFIRYIQSETPKNLLEYQRILGIPAKKGIHKAVDYLTAETMSAIFGQPERACKRGRRDLVLLTLLYDSGARVQELIDLTVSDLRLEAPATVILHGKGRKMRCIPLMSPTVQLLRNYLSECGLYGHPEKSGHPLFFNSRKQKLTRAGISYIINKYLSAARSRTKIILPDNISPHVFRHSKAMHMLQAGVNLIYIRDFLGHVNVTTTEIYAKADADAKRRALEQAYINVSDLSHDDWNEDKGLMEWLSALCK
jgi:site-specific recombinase XerD